jgi:hypothetical protein
VGENDKGWQQPQASQTETDYGREQSQSEPGMGQDGQSGSGQTGQGNRGYGETGTSEQVTRTGDEAANPSMTDESGSAENQGDDDK